ncbi:MAG TPA: YihY/virulence factor BrkB family protein [Verrucomicrobiae bacterium]|nr:YihY/virulence factor BrkB family protein [Verrucomicrobiae bacterium]
MPKSKSRFEQFREQAENLWDEKPFRAGAESTRLYKFLHFWVLVVKSFIRNRCPVRASALSYSTLLAMIPMLAVALGVTSSLLKDQGEDSIERFIERMVASLIPPANTGTNFVFEPEFDDLVTPLPERPQSAGDPATGLPNLTVVVSNAAPQGTNVAVITATNLNSADITNQMVMAAAAAIRSDVQDNSRISSVQKTAARQINDFIQRTRSGTLGITGTILLIVVAIRMLSQIEETFNDIWGVTCGRSWPLRIIIYWTSITLGPLLLASALGLSGGAHFKATREVLVDMPIVGGLILPAVTLGIIWLAFSMFYKAVPNTKVHFNAALVGGMVAGTLWHLNNVFAFVYVSRVATNFNMYGGLALVPLFMAGLFISWVILLFGAQVSYAFQNRALYLQEKLAENVNQRGREFVALRLMTAVGQRFLHGMPSASVNEMSTELGIPSRLIQQVLQTLMAAHLVVELSGEEPRYLPARPLENITAHHVLQAMRATQGQELLTRDEPVRAEVFGEFARIQEAEKDAASKVSLLALASRAEARQQLQPPSPHEEDMKISPALKPSAITPESTTPAKDREETVQASAAKPDANAPIAKIEIPTAQEEAAAAAHTEVVGPTKDDERTFPL